MKIEHIAFWVKDLEAVKDFYMRYFGMSCSEKYVNPKKAYASYFLSYGMEGTRIEIMNRPDISGFTGNKGMTNGLAHISFSVGSKARVDELTELIRSEGYVVEGEPRTTGDGYYESVVLDPEGNYIEICE